MQQFLFDFNDLPTPAYLVGGWVRDRLLNRQGRYLDLDFVLPEEAIETANTIARKYKAGFVVLDAERQIARVVFKNGTADFAQQMGNTLEADLGRRDFCMNAIAIECHQLAQDQEQFIDPFDGIGDLKAKQIRMVAPENLAEDPLRILRGYRQAAQLQFEIEGLTRQVLTKLAPNLKLVAAERVRTELSYLLSVPNSSNWITEIINDRILESWLPRQHLNLERFAKIERAIALLLAQFPSLELFITKILAGDRDALELIKLTALTNNATTLEILGLSRVEQRWVTGILRYMPQFISLLDHASPTEQYKFFQVTLEFFPAIAALAIASDYSITTVAPWLERWLNPDDAIAYPHTLITGDDLRQNLGIAPSPRIGGFLEMVKIAQVEGKIYTKAEALSMIQAIIEGTSYK